MNFTITDKIKKDIFISIFNLLKHSSSQINASFTSDKLHIQGMDKSHVCLFELNLDQKWFHSYTVNEAGKCCFDTNSFYSMISVKSDNQSLNIRQQSEDELAIELIDGSDYNKYFTLPLLECEYDEMVIPTTDYDAEFSLPSKRLTDMITQLNTFGDDINIICSDDFVDFKTKGSTGEMRVNIPIDDLTSYSVVEGDPINLTYSLIYITKMCVTNKLTNEVDFSLSGEYPMKINYDLGENSSLVFYIAPKVSDD